MKAIKIFLIFTILLSFFSCEEEGTPLTLEELYSVNGISTAKFSATVGPTPFETDKADGLFVNNALAITAQTDIRTLVIGVESIEAGTYLGSTNNLKNYINFSDSNGVVFTSTKQGVESDVIISIANFDGQNGLISGKFSGTLYDLNSNGKINIYDGQFVKVKVEVPYFGEMKAAAGATDFQASSCIFASSMSGGFIFETIASSANSDTLSLSFTIDEKIQEKDYFFDRDPITGRYNSNVFSTNVFKNQYTSETGKLTISQIDTINNQVKGSFDFDARNFQNEVIKIRDGSFTAIIQN